MSWIVLQRRRNNEVRPKFECECQPESADTEASFQETDKRDYGLIGLAILLFLMAIGGLVIGEMIKK